MTTTALKYLWSIYSISLLMLQYVGNILRMVMWFQQLMRFSVSLRLYPQRDICPWGHLKLHNDQKRQINANSSSLPAKYPFRVDTKAVEVKWALSRADDPYVCCQVLICVPDFSKTSFEAPLKSWKLRIAHWKREAKNILMLSRL